MPKHCSKSDPLRTLIVIVALAALTAGCASRQRRAADRQPITSEPFTQETIYTEAEDFFGRGAQGLADVMNRIITDNGQPAAFIKGEEAGGSVGIGLRYGRGVLYLPDGRELPIYWRGPSIGIDVGGSAAKTLILVYDLPYVEALYQRFGGVEGSLYYVGGIGVNYNRNDEIVLAPVRFGVGWRQGINVGYLHLSPRRSWIPF